jgi:hypothetical protein
MFRKVCLALLTISMLKAQSPSSILSQRGGSHNAIFLNPAKLSSSSQDSKLHANFIDTSLQLSHDSYDFFKDLNKATSSSNKNQEISQLLKENIGNTLSSSANNFSSVYQSHENFSWSLGIANTLDSYFITHSGFGSKGAMESSLEKYQIIMSTFALKQENFHYGINLKSLQKTQKLHNYSIREMLENKSFSDYFNNDGAEENKAIGMDAGIVYEVPNNNLNTMINLSVLDIGNTSFKELGSIPSTGNIGLSLQAYENTTLELSYLDIFQHQRNQTTEDSIRVHISKPFFSNSLTLNTGILYNALLYGVNYQYSFFNLGLHSYKTKDYNGQKERKYELSLALTW